MQRQNRMNYMFQTAVLVDERDQLRLLEFQKKSNEVYYPQLNENSPYFQPSGFWSHLAQQTYVGFSSKGLLYQGSFAFPGGTVVPPSPPENTSKLKLIKYQLAQFSYMMRRIFAQDTKALHQRMANYYRECWQELPDSSDVEKRILTDFPMQYFLALEAVKYSSSEKITSYLEVGGGYGITAAMHILRRDVERAFIIDLPMTTVATFIFFRQYLPHIDVYLPNEISEELLNSEAKGVFLMPPVHAHLIPENSVQQFVNMSSFQEMELDILNNYIALAGVKLSKGGQLTSINQQKSRHIPDNEIDNYDLSHFSQIKQSVAPVHSRMGTKFPIPMIALQAIK